MTTFLLSSIFLDGRITAGPKAFSVSIGQAGEHGLCSMSESNEKTSSRQCHQELKQNRWHDFLGSSKKLTEISVNGLYFTKILFHFI